MLRILLSLMLCLPAFVGIQADPPAQLSTSQIDALVARGDRLADQADYRGALEQYTRAYMSVVSEIRGQRFPKTVEPNMFTREELGREMQKMVDEEYTEEDTRLLNASYQALGLVPADLDCVALLKSMLTEEVAGFYDPDTKKMVLIVEEAQPKKKKSWLGQLLGGDDGFDKDAQKTTLAHELTHALQDQLYDLNDMEEDIDEDDDMMLAFSALVEGDATLLMFVENDAGVDVRDLDPGAMRATFTMMSWFLPLAGGKSFRGAPAIFRESLTFPYFQGMLFVMAIASEEGWEGVHRLYKHPPTSTEQILHPQKYITQRDEPQSVQFPISPESIGEDWQHLGGNVLGEFQMSVMLRKIAGGSLAAAGWDGDRYEIYQSKKDGKLAFVSVSVWDSVKDAEEFVAAFEKYQELRNGKPAKDQVSPESSVRLIKRQDKKVTIVEGFQAKAAEAILSHTEKASFSVKQRLGSKYFEP